MAIENYDALLSTMEPRQAEIFKRVLPDGVDNPQIDFMEWVEQFDSQLEKEIAGLPDDEKIIMRGYAALAKKFYNRNRITLGNNERMASLHLQDLKLTVEASKTTEQLLEIGNTILNQFHFATHKESRDIYRYDPEADIFRPDGEEFIEQLIKSNMLKLSKHEIKEIIYHIQTSTFTEPDQFLGAIVGNLLHVGQGGWLNMETMTYEEGTPDRISVAKITAKYDPKAGPKEFIQVVNAALTPQYRRELFKVMGNILIPDARYEKASLFIGDGHNRKSTIIKATIGVIGEDNTSTVAPQQFADDKFAAAELYHKMLNAAADLNAAKINDTGRFKELVSGDRITVQHKYSQPFQMENYAKMLFSANEIPASSDQTNAFFRRWCIIPFYRTFERDPTLYQRLATDEERSGILNLMLYGRRLLIQDDFADIPLEKIRAMYNRNASLVKDFIEAECILDLNNESPDNRTLTGNMQDAYITYQEKVKQRKIDASERNFLQRQLGQELDKLGIERKALHYKGERPYFYLGIKLKSEARQGSAAISEF